MSNNTLLIIGIALALVVIVGLVLRGRGNKQSKAVTPAPPAPSIAPEPPVQVTASEDVDDSGTVTPATTAVVETPDDVATEVVAPAEPTQPAEAAPKPQSLRERLGRSGGSLTSAFRNLFSGASISEDAWTDLEDTLIMADMGVQASAQVIANLKQAVKQHPVSSSDEMLALAQTELTAIVDAGLDRTLHLNRQGDTPAVALTVGVNGTGKTTTTAKIAHLLTQSDLDVLLGAADTFRAAAAEQLGTWADRIGVPVVRGEEGSDPASVAFNAVAEGKDAQVDVVLIDTAGRLHTKQGLMDELGKVYRVVGKQAEVSEVLLVIDATTGQNGLAQAKVFSEVVPVTGVVLSKLDGTAKGGIVVAVQQELGVPVKLVGLGESLDDLAPFEPAEFVAGLLA